MATRKRTEQYRGYGIVVRAPAGDGPRTASFAVTKVGTDGSVEVIVESRECGAGSRNDEEACSVARKAAHAYIDAEISN